MLVNLINKYGIVPKGAFPESSSSEAALQMNKFLRTKVRRKNVQQLKCDFV